jgi:fatty acid desaturase
MDYVELRKEVTDAGLLDRQYGYYAYKAVFNVALLAASIFVLVAVDSFTVQLLNALFLAFVFVQFAMLMHDADHYQVFRSPRMNELLGLVTGNLILNVSSSAWREVHNRHHSSPNHIDEDPDIEAPGLAYSEEQALKKRGIPRFVAKYQAYLWLFIMSFAAFSVRINHHRKVLLGLFRNFGNVALKHIFGEAALLATGTSLYFWLVFNSLGFEKGVAFTTLNYMLTGLYMGTVFATNHKGMPLVDGKERHDFLRVQIMTARNVKSSPLVDLWCGGLNYQIEHHLFPTMPRNNLGKAKKIVERFCREHGIPYHETGFFQSYREILSNFNRISMVLRKPKSGSLQK